MRTYAYKMHRPSTHTLLLSEHTQASTLKPDISQCVTVVIGMTAWRKKWVHRICTPRSCMWAEKGVRLKQKCVHSLPLQIHGIKLRMCKGGSCEMSEYLINKSYYSQTSPNGHWLSGSSIIKCLKLSNLSKPSYYSQISQKSIGPQSRNTSSFRQVAPIGGSSRRWTFILGLLISLRRLRAIVLGHDHGLQERWWSYTRRGHLAIARELNHQFRCALVLFKSHQLRMMRITSARAN